MNIMKQSKEKIVKLTKFGPNNIKFVFLVSQNRIIIIYYANSIHYRKLIIKISVKC